jgi:glycolate oxidase iron-sulfur subunit
MSATAYRGLDPCVHCGFCLPACPTYEVTSDECDSPRGRIVLMRALERGELPAHDEALALHLDRCLGCRGCESVCPSGVVFGPALEEARAAIAKHRATSPMVRAALWALARPERQRAAWRLARLARDTRLPELLARGAGFDGPRVASLLAMLAATRPARRRRTADHSTSGTTRAALFRGCVMNGLFGHVHEATIHALAVNGIETVEVRGQVCCGALAAHAGEDGLARELARANVRAFDDVPLDVPIVVNSAGCGAMLEAYGEWLAGEELETRARALASRVMDVSEILAERGPASGRRPLRLRVAYDAPCHLLHAQKVADAPRAVLRAVPGIEEVQLEGAERCCGSAGLFSLTQPEMSREVLAAKLRAIRAARPDVVATGNPGCMMQIGMGALLEGMRLDVSHPVELLAESYG